MVSRPTSRRQQMVVPSASLVGERTLLTGAGRGMACAIDEAFARVGVIAALNHPPSHPAHDRRKLSGCSMVEADEFSVEADESRDSGARQMALRCDAREGRSKIVANNASALAPTRSLAQVLAPGILVNAVPPGPVAARTCDPNTLSPDAVAGELAIPLTRFSEAKETAETAGFLAGVWARSCTGKCLSPNGGAIMSNASTPNQENQDEL